MHKTKDLVTRSQILLWLNRTLNINETRIENLGNGVAYCMLLNHYCPTAIHPSKIIHFPRTHNDHRTNLRRFQEGLNSHDIRNITFDVFKIAEMTYAQNWILICKLHKHFTAVQKEGAKQHKQTNRQQWWPAKPLENKAETSLSTPSFPPNSGCFYTASFTNPMLVNPMSTPMKGPKFFDEGKSRWQSMNLIEEIKRIVITESHSDRNKVQQLRRLLGLQNEETHEQQPQLRDLLSDYKKKEQVIQID